MTVLDDSTATMPATAEPPVTLLGDQPRTLGLRDQLGLWANLGVSLLLPVAATFIVLPGQSLLATLLAVVVGAVIGGVLLGLGAAPGAHTGAPAMVLLRGLLGHRLSYLPTVINLVQCLGWATFEIVIIAEAASRLTGGPRWAFVLGAGVLATAMALRPLGVVRLLKRYAVWAALASAAYLLIQVLRQPLPPLTEGSFTGFWRSVDIVIALPVSWIPLAADYSRHSRSGRAAFAGAAVGYGASTVAFFSLGVLALVGFGLTPGFDVIDVLLALPLAAIAVAVLVADEVDEAFANVYSTAVSAQNIAPRLDRRGLAIAVGTLATVLALSLDVVSYEPFLFLIGSVFVPLVGTFAVAYYLLRRGAWDVGEGTRSRWRMLLPWGAGFVAYQLTTPTYFATVGSGWTTWWSARQDDLGIAADHGLSASIIALTVATILTAVVGFRPHRGR